MAYWSAIHFISVVVCVFNLDFNTVNADDRWSREYKQLVEDVSAITDWNTTDFPGYECWAEREAGKPPLGEELVFPCDDVHAPSDVIPNSAHRVRIADVNVIGAMGDSISAGNGAVACIYPEVIYQARGRIYSHGADESFERNPSLANIIKKFNPDLKGTGKDWGSWDSDEAGMNVANPGDKANDMPHQAEWLIQKMKADRNIDYENDWKVITMFIGGNDLCDWCEKPEKLSPDNYVRHIHDALMILHDNMPRTIVNVVQILQVFQLDILRAPVCDFFHLLVCSCATFLTEDEFARFYEINREYQTKLEADIMSGQYDDKEDFTVVLQPFLEETDVPFLENGDPDFSYFAPDCFHFSAKGHAQSGIELWNNMIEPVGNKRKSWQPSETTISCPPKEFPYIYTNLNSDPSFWKSPAPTEARTGSRGSMVSQSISVPLFALLGTLYLILNGRQ